MDSSNQTTNLLRAISYSVSSSRTSLVELSIQTVKLLESIHKKLDELITLTRVQKQNNVEDEKFDIETLQAKRMAFLTNYIKTKIKESILHRHSKAEVTILETELSPFDAMKLIESVATGCKVTPPSSDSSLYTIHFK